MATEKKIETVKDLADKLNRSKLTVFTDYRGLSTPDLVSLRNELADNSSEYQIAKNTLMTRALKEAGKNSLVSDQVLEGPTAVLFAYQDEVSPLKSVFKLIKAAGLPVIKSGVLGDQSIDATQVETLSKLPAKEVLIAKVVGGFASPLYSIVNVLQGNIRNLVYVLNAVKGVK